MKKGIFTIEEKRPLAADVWELVLSGDASAVTRPGQFVNIELTGHYLRRPISVCDWTADSLRLVVKVLGGGTRQLVQLPLGTRLDLLTGLGNGFDPDRSGKQPVLAGGGVGVPPLYGLAKALLARGVLPVVALGFGTAADVFYTDEFAALGCPVYVSTMDGSRGDRGLITDLLRHRAKRCDYLYTCGPERMLRAVYEIEALPHGQFSFEERMGCGFGACMGCTCHTKYGYKRICKDGPVLEKEEIVW